MLADTVRAITVGFTSYLLTNTLRDNILLTNTVVTSTILTGTVTGSTALAGHSGPGHRTCSISA
jgi:hypothetical protein